MHGDALYAERTLRAGATGYITEHQAADQIAQAVRRVLTGEVYPFRKNRRRPIAAGNRNQLRCG